MIATPITAEWARQLCLNAFGTKEVDHIVFIDPGIRDWYIADPDHLFGVKRIELKQWFDFINQEYSIFGYDPETKTFAIWETTTKREAQK